MVTAATVAAVPGVFAIACGMRPRHALVRPADMAADADFSGGCRRWPTLELEFELELDTDLVGTATTTTTSLHPYTCSASARTMSLLFTSPIAAAASAADARRTTRSTCARRHNRRQHTCAAVAGRGARRACRPDTPARATTGARPSPLPALSTRLQTFALLLAADPRAPSEQQVPGDVRVYFKIFLGGIGIVVLSFVAAFISGKLIERNYDALEDEFQQSRERAARESGRADEDEV